MPRHYDLCGVYMYVLFSYIHTYTSARRIYVCIYVYICTYTYVYLYVCTLIYAAPVCMHVCLREGHTHTHTHTHTVYNTYIHTHIYIGLFIHIYRSLSRIYGPLPNSVTSCHTPSSQNLCGYTASREEVTKL